MRLLRNVISSLLPACCIALVFTVTPIDSTYTAGVIGAEPVCAQDPGGVERCMEAHEIITGVLDLFCPPGTRAHCEIACNLDGEVGQVNCICAQ